MTIPTKAERDEILPIGSVIHALGIHQGSWLKINHRIDVPTNLLVGEYIKHKVRAEEMEALLREYRRRMSCATEDEYQGLQERIDRLLEGKQ